MDNIKIQKVLRYLGYKGQKVESEFLDRIKELIVEACNSFRFKVVYSRYEIKKQDNLVEIVGTNLKIKSKDINRLLNKSNTIYLIAVTLGNDIERLIRKYERISMRDALILDACATVAIGDYIDNLQEKIKSDELEIQENFTLRYSPGYGDLSLEVQKDIINILNCEKRIGVTVSEKMILFPRKTITAILGVIEGKKIKKSCLNCKNYSTCDYREDGESSEL